MDGLVWLAIACIFIMVIVRFRHTKRKSKVHMDKAAKIQAELKRLRDKRNE
ncbi:hypothetical protein [Paenibacillus albiflavus]|uniref:hypothetical protein n=1 Tax=Paenibacillus albiflavus TaxID=2545760 RepID=UPI00140551FB|nr:hypothetical protein [Paenibacillus albiflavus]